MHQNIEAGFNRQGPELDKAYAALISDLMKEVYWQHLLWCPLSLDDT